ncbi:hypothetical protein C1O24_20335 [Vibrio diazotrophicus]|nr:hypothetical protein C1O24_20335 [Vibrio diazotrophicus]
MDNLIQKDSVSSVLKVFTILQALGERNESGLSELSKRLKMSKASTYRFLQTMKSIGFVDQKGEADKYVLTLKLFELGSKAREYTSLIDCSGQLKLATILEFSQYNRSDSLGVRPPLY